MLIHIISNNDIGTSVSDDGAHEKALAVTDCIPRAIIKSICTVIIRRQPLQMSHGRIPQRITSVLGTSKSGVAFLACSTKSSPR